MTWTKRTVRDLNYSALAPPQRRILIMPGRARAFEAALAALVTAILYQSLNGELPYHDESRFDNQINSGRFVWDIAHIFMQPATLLWHWYLGFGEPAEVIQKHINTFATALGIGVFYALLQRLEIPRWDRVWAALLVMASSSLITLGPSGHMKLLAFPFMNAALYLLVDWEQPAICHDAKSTRRLVCGAGVLAVASSFLVSALATAPFAALAVLCVRLRQGAGWRKGLMSAALFSIVCGVTFLLLACAGYATFTGAVPTLHGLAGSVTQKADLKPSSYGILMTVARLVFGTVNNLVAAPDLGPVSRAWISGEVPSLVPY
jgi:hypothetical protein